MMFSADQWIVLTIVLVTVIVINLIIWLVVLSDQEKHRRQASKIIAHKTPPSQVLPAAAREELERHAKERFAAQIEQTAAKLDKALNQTQAKLAGDLTARTAKVTSGLNTARDNLQSDLQKTSAQLNEHITSVTSTMLEEELQTYRNLLSDARKTVAERLAAVHDAMEEQRTKAEQEVRAEIRAEKAELMTKFDTKLAEVLSAYLVESLGQNVDLGAQTKYIFNSLNEHKKELKEDILNDF